MIFFLLVLCFTGIFIYLLYPQLMKYLNAPMAATCNPERLTEEFPIWLEKISTKFPAGIIFVLDSADRFPVSRSMYID